MKGEAAKSFRNYGFEASRGHPERHLKRNNGAGKIQQEWGE